MRDRMLSRRRVYCAYRPKERSLCEEWMVVSLRLVCSR